MIIGASNTAVQLAKMLERSMSVKLIDNDTKDVKKYLNPTKNACYQREYNGPFLIEG